jgi:hypothetical protein
MALSKIDCVILTNVQWSNHTYMRITLEILSTNIDPIKIYQVGKRRSFERLALMQELESNAKLHNMGLMHLKISLKQ